MKNILITLFLLNINISVFAQRTNAHGQYMVKTATWKSYGGQSSFKMDLGYYLNGNLKEVTKNYELNGKKYRDTYSISYNSKGERILKVSSINSIYPLVSDSRTL